jgi:hypothetical protein
MAIWNVEVMKEVTKTMIRRRLEILQALIEEMRKTQVAVGFRQE